MSTNRLKRRINNTPILPTDEKVQTPTSVPPTDGKVQTPTSVPRRLTNSLKRRINNTPSWVAEKVEKTHVTENSVETLCSPLPSEAIPKSCQGTFHLPSDRTSGQRPSCYN